MGAPTAAVAAKQSRGRIYGGAAHGCPRGRTYTHPVVPPPCRGPAVLGLRAVSWPSLARVASRVARSRAFALLGVSYSFWAVGVPTVISGAILIIRTFQAQVGPDCGYRPRTNNANVSKTEPEVSHTHTSTWEVAAKVLAAEAIEVEAASMVKQRQKLYPAPSRVGLAAGLALLNRLRNRSLTVDSKLCRGSLTAKTVRSYLTIHVHVGLRGKVDEGAGGLEPLAEPRNKRGAAGTLGDGEGSGP
jgi:hypothetical protein